MNQSTRNPDRGAVHELDGRESTDPLHPREPREFIQPREPRAAGPAGQAGGAPSKGFFGLSVPQLIGGASAAVSTAVVASFLGVAGTLIGAALGSIVSTISAAVYTSMARDAHSRVRMVTVRPGRDARSASGTPSSHSSPRASTAATTHPGPRHAWNLAVIRRAIKPRALLAGAGVIFVIAIGAITALEVGLGRPVSASEPTGSTSLGRVVQDVSGQSAPSTPSDVTPTPSDSATSEPTPGQDPSSIDGRNPTASPTDGATVQPSDGQTPQDVPSAEPTQQPEPQPTADAPAPAQDRAPAPVPGQGPTN
ncbi:MAG: hypothetical protein Q4P32_04345 [Micrococcales bacterium]|nr:hypothetical protein [Micrococcales bacterium]